MAVFAYEQETYRPVEFNTPLYIEDGLAYVVKIHSDDQEYDVTSAEETVLSDKALDTTAVICDFESNDVPPGQYTIVVQTASPTTVVSKDILILFDKTGFSF